MSVEARLPSNVLTNEVTLLIRLNTSLTHRFLVHLRMRLAVKLIGSIIAKRDTLEKIIDPQQFYHSLPMCNIGIREEPHLHLTFVNALEQTSQLLIRLDDIL